jgi:diaminopimelate epimerase
MFNADGSEGEMCGNGIRCFVRYVFDNEMLPASTSPVTVETPAGIKRVTPIWDQGAMVRATVDMGGPRLRADEIPVDLPGREVVLDYPMQVDGHRFAISCVSMGNPHAVAFVDEAVDDFPLHEIGPLVERNRLFPERVNFEIANVKGTELVKARVWERGSGLTEACGSGACAIAVAARMHGYIGDEVDIDLPGGSLSVTWPGEGDVVLEGPVAHVFDGEWPD